MKNINYLFLKLEELKRENIISGEQNEAARKYFSVPEKEKASITTIITAIGVLLVALSMITIVAFNWDNIGKEIKTILAFIPIVLTAVMLYITMKKDDARWKIYTSIFAPIAIIATNSLITQIFHIQTEIFEMFFFCLLMFFPIAFILKNNTSAIIYGLGALIYVANASHIPENFLNCLIVMLPMLALLKNKIGLIFYGITTIVYVGNTYMDAATIWFGVITYLPFLGASIYSYIKNRDSKVNIFLWIFNVISLSYLLFANGNSNTVYALLRPEVTIIYIYSIYLATKVLFGDKNIFSILFSIFMIAFLIIFSIDEWMLDFASTYTFGLDTLILSIITLGLIYKTQIYKNIKEIILLLAVMAVQYTALDNTSLFVIVNLLVALLGIYYIFLGSIIKKYSSVILGIAIVLLLITFRFVNSDLDFMQKSIMFLITGTSFIITANLMKKKLGGNK